MEYDSKTLDRLLIEDVGIMVWLDDPIDGGRILRDESRDMLFDWCRDHCRGRFWVGMGFGRFEYEDDALLFRFRWA